MSKAKIAFLFLLTFVFMFGCQQEATLDPDSLVKQLLTEVISEEMLEISRDRLRIFYPGLVTAVSPEAFNVTKVFLCAEAVLADEIAIFQVREARSVNQAKAAITAHYQERAGVYADYAPHEAERIRKRAFVEQGRWLITVICDDPARASEIIKAAFK